MGADPASSPLLGGAVNRPLARVEDLARELVRSLPPSSRAGRSCRPRRPPTSSPPTAPRREGDRVIPLAGIWRDERFPDPRAGQAAGAQRRDRRGGRLPDDDHRALEYTATPKGVAGRDLDAGQRELLLALLGTYFDRVPDASRPSPLRRRRARRRPLRLGRPDGARARTTTGSRDRGCSSSGTTPSAAPTTRTRSGATPRPTSASTCWRRTAAATTDDRFPSSGGDLIGGVQRRHELRHALEPARCSTALSDAESPARGSGCRPHGSAGMPDHEREARDVTPRISAIRPTQNRTK